MAKQDKDFAGVQEIMRVEYDVDVEQAHLPSMQQYEMFKKWVCWADDVDPEGRWLGFCPLHDKKRKTEGSAVFNFVNATYWCNGEPRCTSTRALSLQNLIGRCAALYLQ